MHHSNQEYPLGNRRLQNGGEMGELIQSYDWSASEIGAPETWPETLFNTLNLLLHARFPMLLWWGKNHIQFYNDAYRPILGSEGKHPKALGQPARECWQEVWDDIESLIRQVYLNGESVWKENQAYAIMRNNLIEHAYFTFSYSPIQNDSGEIAGVLVVCQETTQQMLSDQLNRKLMFELDTLNLELIEKNNKLQLLNSELKISQQVLTEQNQELLNSEERFRMMVEGTDVLIILQISASSKLYFNSAWTRFTGLTTAALENFDWIDFIHEEDRPDYIARLKAAIENGQGFAAKLRIRDMNGKLRYFLAKTIAHENKEGQIIGYVSSYLDITVAQNEIIRKNEFLSLIGHELNTPLTALSGFIEMMHEAKESPPDSFTAVALEKSFHQVRKMKRTINDFLDLSRLDGSGIDINKQLFPLKELITEIVGEKSSLRGGYPIKFADTEHEVIINADRHKIAVVLMKLLSNAIKFSVDRKPVEIEYSCSDVEVIVRVTDYGVGISPDHQRQIFTRYFRVEENWEIVSGFGIGLYLCAQIIQLHGGRIWVNSELNKGSVFSFALPFGK